VRGRCGSNGDADEVDDDVDKDDDDVDKDDDEGKTAVGSLAELAMFPGLSESASIIMLSFGLARDK